MLKLQNPIPILALYNKTHHVAALAHIDSLTDISSLANIFAYIRPNCTNPHLYGGSSDSADLCVEVINLLNKHNIEIVNTDIGKYGFENQASLAIDARSGKIYSPIRCKDLSTSNMPEIELTKSTPIAACFIDNKIKKIPSKVTPEDQEIGDFRGFKRGFLL